MLIADYSSVIFDYALYQKPIVLFVPDYDEFVSTRGLYIDLNEVSLEDNTCKIKYESIYEIKKINIDPDTVTIEK